MSEDLFIEKLAWFKQNEKPEAVLLVADNPERVKLAIAWTNLYVKRAEHLTDFKGESEKDVWEWLWRNTQYSRTELKEIIGTSLSKISLEGKIKPLIGNRVLYPDGTVNSFVQRYLREQVVKLFDTKPKRPAKKS